MNEPAPPPHIPLGTEIRLALLGAGRLFLFDADGLRYFNASITGFWRSFLAAAISAPLYGLLLVIQDRLVRASAGSEVPPLADRIAVEIVTYPLGWALYPVAMIGLARLLNVTGRYVPYIIAYNWANLLAVLLALIPHLLYAAGLLEARGALAALMGMNFVLLVYIWFVARRALAVPFFTAIGLVAIDVMLGLMLEAAADQLAG